MLSFHAHFKTRMHRFCQKLWIILLLYNKFPVTLRKLHVLPVPLQSCKDVGLFVSFNSFFFCPLPLHLCRNDCPVSDICTRCQRKMSQIFIFIFLFIYLQPLSTAEWEYLGNYKILLKILYLLFFQKTSSTFVLGGALRHSYVSWTLLIFVFNKSSVWGMSFMPYPNIHLPWPLLSHHGTRKKN